MNKKYQVAEVTLKKVIWDGKRKVPVGTVFKDEKCFEGKYLEDTADVKFMNQIPEPPEEPEEEPEEDEDEDENENDLTSVLTGK